MGVGSLPRRAGIFVVETLKDGRGGAAAAREGAKGDAARARSSSSGMRAVPPARGGPRVATPQRSRGDAPDLWTAMSWMIWCRACTGSASKSSMSETSVIVLLFLQQAYGTMVSRTRAAAGAGRAARAGRALKLSNMHSTWYHLVFGLWPNW